MRHREHKWTGWKANAYAALHRNSATNKSIVDWAGLEPGMDIVDIGCGPGSAVAAAALRVGNGSAVGIDISPEFVEIARHRHRTRANASFQVGRAEALPFDDDSFDVAWSIHSVHHWQDSRAGMTEAHRVLHPGGTFLIVERFAPKRPWGIDGSRAETLAAELKRAGFIRVAVSTDKAGGTTEFVLVGSTPAHNATNTTTT